MLVNAANMYSSLYDVLNKHYTCVLARDGAGGAPVKSYFANIGTPLRVPIATTNACGRL